MVELNVPYTSKFIAEELFHIKSSTFNNKKQKYLQHLKQYYQYEITDKKKIILRKELKPFKTKMQVRERTKANQTQIYRDLTHKIIFHKPLNSGSNIAREIDQSPMKPIENHKQSTIENYIRPILKEDFEVISKKWSRINYDTNEYEPLTQEQSMYLYQLFRSKDLSEEIMDITADYKAGNISKQEFATKVGSVSEFSYDKAIKDFKKKFGFRPFKASNWQEKQKVG